MACGSQPNRAMSTESPSTVASGSRPSRDVSNTRRSIKAPCPAVRLVRSDATQQLGASSATTETVLHRYRIALRSCSGSTGNGLGLWHGMNPPGAQHSFEILITLVSHRYLPRQRGWSLDGVPVVFLVTGAFFAQ
jgi:hypothetical protein